MAWLTIAGIFRFRLLKNESSDEWLPPAFCRNIVAKLQRTDKDWCRPGIHAKEFVLWNLLELLSSDADTAGPVSVKIVFIGPSRP
jgi:hypothetical protein